MLGNFLPNVKLHVPITEILHLLNLIAVFTEMNKIFIIICGIVSEKGKKTHKTQNLISFMITKERLLIERQH